MQNDFTTAMSETTVLFQQFCVPELKKIMVDFEFMSIEGNSNSTSSNLLDMSAGIDVLAYSNDGVRGLASRVQYGKNWQTFTIRSERQSGTLTEYKKRRVAIEQDFLYPFYTLQAYVRDNQLQGLAICQTKALFDLILSGSYYEQSTGRNQIGQAYFLVVDWSIFDEKHIRIFNKENGWIYTPSMPMPDYKDNAA